MSKDIETKEIKAVSGGERVAVPPPQPKKEIPDCTVCGGERELSGRHGYICYHCGVESRPI